MNMWKDVCDMRKAEYSWARAAVGEWEWQQTLQPLSKEVIAKRKKKQLQKPWKTWNILVFHIQHLGKNSWRDDMSFWAFWSHMKALNYFADHAKHKSSVTFQIKLQSMTAIRLP